MSRPHGEYDASVTAPMSHLSACCALPGGRPVIPARSQQYATPSLAPPPVTHCHPAGWHATHATADACRGVLATDAESTEGGIEIETTPSPTRARASPSPSPSKSKSKSKSYATTAPSASPATTRDAHAG